jgi:hypothetical protein
MGKETGLQLNEKRINELGMNLADFAVKNIASNNDLSLYDRNKLLVMFGECYADFIRYAESHELLNKGEEKVLTENEADLDAYIKEIAINIVSETLDGE